MALRIEDHGTGNTVTVAPMDHAALHGTVLFTGHGAHVSIGAGCLDTGLRIEAGTGAQVAIGAANHLGALFVHAAAGTRVHIGAGCGFNGLVRLLLHEPGAIAIGDGCLLSSDVDLTVSDMHPVFDAASGARINPAADIVLADRVWVGQRALLLKGVHVGADSVIGAAAVVTNPVPPGCVAAGNPARVVRTGVRWRMDLQLP